MTPDTLRAALTAPPFDDERHVLRLITAAGPEGIRRGYLLARSGMRAAGLDAITAALVAAGLVAETVETPAVGRPARVYREVGR